METEAVHKYQNPISNGSKTHRHCLRFIYPAGCATIFMSTIKGKSHVITFSRAGVEQQFVLSTNRFVDVVICRKVFHEYFSTLRRNNFHLIFVSFGCICSCRVAQIDSLTTFTSGIKW